MEINKNTPIFNNWYIEEKLGSGAYGTVYKIKREEFGKTFYSALKVIQIPSESSEVDTLRSEGMDNNSITAYYGEIVQELVQEISILNSLKGNSNIVSYEDHSIITEEEGKKYTIFIRMELLTPLNTCLIDRKLTDKEIVKLGMDLCAALRTCDQHNIIHRDIKPDNIFVTADGNFKLGDFGVARTMEKTMSAMSQKGTYTYMAPEVYYGKSYDRTVDLYSLGLVLYQLLNGNRAPFLPSAPNPIKFSDRENAMKRRMGGEALPPLNTDNRKLNEVILRACAFDRNSRYKTADEMRSALENSIYKEEQKEMCNEMDFDKTVSLFDKLPTDAENVENFESEKQTPSETDLDKTVSPFDKFPTDAENIKNFETERHTASETVLVKPNDYAATVVAPQHKLFEAYKLAWTNYANFKGRARCSDYWNFVLANVIITVGLSVVSVPLMSVLGIFGEIPLLLYWLASIIPSVSLMVRRLHDVGKEWYWIFLSLIPTVGLIILLVWCAGDGEKGANKFGESPKYVKQLEGSANQNPNFPPVHNVNTQGAGFCSNCGSRLNSDSVFCPNCGKQV